MHEAKRKKTKECSPAAAPQIEHPVIASQRFFPLPNVQMPSIHLVSGLLCGDQPSVSGALEWVPTGGGIGCERQSPIV